MALAAYLVLALLAAAAAAPEGRASSRIVGGTPTTIEEFPYIVALVYTYPGPGITIQRCVGTLVSSWHVLTTAFCFTGANNDNMRVRAGSTNSLSGGTLVGIGDVITHPDYEREPRAADLTVTFLANALVMSNVISVLYLPAEGSYIPDGYGTKVVSWGFESEGGAQLELLKTIILNKVDTETCAEQYAENEEIEINDKVICASAAGKGMCLGDSGAPMVIGQAVVGISSYSADCEDTYPDVFTRIDRFSNWIVEVARPPGAGEIYARSAPIQL